MPELLLPRLKREIEARLAELRPLVAEAERLEAAKEALLAEAAAEGASARRRARSNVRSGVTRSAMGDADAARADAVRANGASANGSVATGAGRASAASAAAATSPVADETDADADGRAPRGANQSAILAIVEERPGVSVAEISSVTKIPKPTVATTVSKLKREGVLADEAGGVKLASRQPLTLSQVAAAAPVREDGVSDEEWEAARREGAVA